jgi:hydroxymethylpyrimidine pyrophosphatase-like HAD family hydrolase
MYRKVLVFDYDGTLAENARVPVELCQALEQLAAAGYSLFLATGRLYQSIELGDLERLFTGIIWENGAVLSQPQWGELYLPFGHVDPQLVSDMEQAGVPLEQGLAIVSTWASHEEIVAQAISRSGTDAVVAHNKGAIMILPPGTAKGTGLERMLELSGLSARNVISFGDGENDLSLLQSSEGSVAVASAVQSLQTVADLVTCHPGPAGVLEALQTYWLANEHSALPSKQSRQIPLGQDAEGAPISLAGSWLASQNLGVFGDSATGKSWVTGLLVEGMHRAGYQVLLIDPEGDHRGLRSLPRMMAIGGDESTLPDPTIISLLLEEASNSVVLDLCAYPVDQREQYISELIHQLHALKRHRYRPHWIILEEAQEFLPLSGKSTLPAILPILNEGGWAFVSYRPDHLAAEVRESLQACLITRVSEPTMVQALTNCTNLPPTEALASTRLGSVWLCGQQVVRLHTAGRRVLHIRHLYKYLDAPLPKHKRFYFRTDKGYLGMEAASLFEFKELIPKLPLASLTYHQTRGDFAKWIREALGDETLAAHLEKLAHREQLTAEALRQALLQRVAERYVELYRMQ